MTRLINQFMLQKGCINDHYYYYNTRASNESSFETRKLGLKFWETSIFYTHHSKRFQEMIYFLRNITITIRTYIKYKDQRNLRVQFEQSCV